MKESERLLKSILVELQCFHRDFVMEQSEISEDDKRLLIALTLRTQRMASRIKTLAKKLSVLDAAT